jgi:hypothetical protein
MKRILLLIAVLIPACDFSEEEVTPSETPMTFSDHMRSLGATEEEIVLMQEENLAYDMAGCTSLTEAERALLPTCGGIVYSTILCHCNAVKCGTWASPADSHTTAKRAQCSGGAAVNRSASDKSKDIHFGPGDSSCGTPNGECWSLYCGTPAVNYSLWYPTAPACTTWGSACTSSAQCCDYPGQPGDDGQECIDTLPGTPGGEKCCYCDPPGAGTCGSPLECD